MLYVHQLLLDISSSLVSTVDTWVFMVNVEGLNY